MISSSFYVSLFSLNFIPLKSLQGNLSTCQVDPLPLSFGRSHPFQRFPQPAPLTLFADSSITSYHTSDVAQWLVLLGRWVAHSCLGCQCIPQRHKCSHSAVAIIFTSRRSTGRLSSLPTLFRLSLRRIPVPTICQLQQCQWQMQLSTWIWWR